MGVKRKEITLFALIVVILAISCACSTGTEPSTDPHPNITHQENNLFATPDNSVISPSGDYVLKIENGFDDSVYTNRFLIYASVDDASLVFKSVKNYRTRDRLYFLWDEKDNVWVYSGDIGATLWSKDNSIWVEQYPAPDDKPIALLEALNAHN